MDVHDMMAMMAGDIRDLIDTVSGESASLAVVVLNVRRLYRNGDWQPMVRHDHLGNLFMLATALIVGILWAWEPQVRRWAAKEMGR